ncbi:sensor histidine kinase [Aeromicrobium sp.]|uniref:sensor histidine kinase n=1 Tax=Aeromicrobium sp. TaxID=1871063 RepID=UPI003D6C5088
MSLASATIGWAIAGLLLVASGLVLCLQAKAYPAGVLFAVSGALLAGVHWAPADGRAYVGLAAVATLVAAIATYPRFERGLATWLTLAALAVGTPALAWTLARDNGLSDIDFVAIVLATVTVAATHVWWRLETTPAADREPLLWVLSASGIVGLLVWIVALPGDRSRLAPVVAASVGLLGVAAAVGAGPAGRLDGRWLASRAIVSAFTVAFLFAGATLVFTLFMWRTGSPPGIVPMAVAAVVLGGLWNPVRRMVSETADAILFGYRPDALSAVQQVAGSVGDDPAAAVRAIQEGLVLPYAALALDGEEPITVGTIQDRVRAFPIDADGGQLGTLTVGVRAGDQSLSKDDERVLTLALPLLVQTVRARTQTASLLRARALGATAREEERRRLRRDLHDGLGPRLTGIAFTVDAARLVSERDGSVEMLDRIRRETETAIHEIRELVYGLRPPALDELGLVGALSVNADAFPSVTIDIEASDVPALPAALEVAAYRIVMEALTNIARHSGATSARVALGRTADSLTIEVSDNGQSSGDWTPGVGLTSMRERARELGGTLAFHTNGAGSTIVADLPLSIE